MIFCLDIGNTHIFGGVYLDQQLKMQFRYPSSLAVTSDQLGVFFKSVLHENNIEIKQITQIAICSVVPALDYSIRSAFLKYFSIDPFFLQINSSRFLTIDYESPQELGADRLSNAIAAIRYFPNKNIIVVDLGTATTFDIINAHKTYLGGVIFPGLSISVKALHEKTAKLYSVNIIKPETIMGKTTAANIQAGLYYGHLGAVREILQRITATCFQNIPPIIIGTGGFAYLFAEENIFHKIIPELVLQGLKVAVTEK